jgi:hypothetical protein
MYAALLTILQRSAVIVDPAHWSSNWRLCGCGIDTACIGIIYHLIRLHTHWQP